MKLLPDHVPCAHCLGKKLCDCPECGKDEIRNVDFAAMPVKVWSKGTCMYCKGLDQLAALQPTK